MQLRPSDATNLAGQTDEDTGRAHISHSAVGLFLACPRKWEFKYRQHLELIGRSRPLSTGKAFQFAIEHQNPIVGVRSLRGEMICDECQANGEVQVSPDDWERCSNCDGEGFIKTAEGRLSSTQEQEDRLRIDEAIVEGASILYLKHWPAGPGETREFEYRVRLRSPWTGRYSKTFDLLGKADGVVERFGNMTPYELIENKLVGSISPQKVQRLPLDRQIALARYGIWRATGRKVEKVRYRWIKKPSIRQKQSETVDQFCDRVRQDYEDRPDFYMHEEEPQFATTGDLLRIEAELWTWAEQLRHAGRQGIYPRNTSACSDFGGCDFIPVCTGDPDAMSLYYRQGETPHSKAFDAIDKLRKGT